MTGTVPDDEAFRREVLDFLSRRFTPALRGAASRQTGMYADIELSRSWWGILYEQGWITPDWPVEFGGTGWTPSQRHIFETECAIAGTPILPALGLRLCGPVLIRYGTKTQQDYFLPRIRSGEAFFCQGYSEPQAGSDLAALQTRAVRDDDHFIVNGTKIWTTYAQYSNWIFLLVRTAVGGKPQEGISFLLAPMDLPGIRVTPIRSISGEHEVNQVFFDDVRVPAAYLVGEEDRGWDVAKYLLEYERGNVSHSARIHRQLTYARKAINARSAGRDPAQDPQFQDYCELEIAGRGIGVIERHLTARLTAGIGSIGTMSSMLKLLGAETVQKATELAFRAQGDYAMVAPGPQAGDGLDDPVAAAATVNARYLNYRAITIYGGSSQIQRNILARSLINL